ncbi:hypothetical protein BDI4_590059 [Burkholderia diffusa]|nr:hypothetical protein BDI4_590059 [Burkholderia diffusa]
MARRLFVIRMKNKNTWHFVRDEGANEVRATSVPEAWVTVLIPDVISLSLVIPAQIGNQLVTRPELRRDLKLSRDKPIRWVKTSNAAGREACRHDVRW